jgi:hypothetical protein
MPYNNNAFGGRGFENQAPSVSRTYWRAPANSVTTAASITVGTVVVQDVLERGAATIGGATRSAVAGAPRYTVAGSNVGADVQENVAIADASTATNQKALVLLDDSLEAGRSGKFASTGRVKAIVYGHTGSAASALTRGSRLSVSVVASNLGKLKLAAVGEMVQAILLEDVGSGLSPTVEVQLLQDPYVTSVIGSA